MCMVVVGGCMICVGLCMCVCFVNVFGIIVVRCVCKILWLCMVVVWWLYDLCMCVYDLPVCVC